MASPLTIDDIENARARIKESAIRTPLVRLNANTGTTEVYLKLENLQPIGSFKLRGAGNAILQATPEQLKNGVYTASAGNMAQGVAWHARRLGISCTVIVPDHAPKTKLAAIERLGARYVQIPFDEWWQVLSDHHFPGQEGFFIHPVSDPAVMAGNGTIGLEILEDLPDVDAVLVPYGGGGLSVGIATALRAMKPDTAIYATEVESSAALAAAWEFDEPTDISYHASFVDGIGSGRVLDEMWPQVRSLLDGALVVSLKQVAAAIRVLAERNRVIAEGAGAAPVAAALSGKAPGDKIVCIVSGGNIDLAKLVDIFNGEI